MSGTTPRRLFVHGVPGGQGNGYRTGDSAMDSRRSDSRHSAGNGSGSQYRAAADTAGGEDRPEGWRCGERRKASAHSEKERGAGGGGPIRRGRTGAPTAPATGSRFGKGRSGVT